MGGRDKPGHDDEVERRKQNPLSSPAERQRGEGDPGGVHLKFFIVWVPFPHFARKRAKLAGDDRWVLPMPMKKRVDRAAHELRQDRRQWDAPLSGITVIDQVT